MRLKNKVALVTGGSQGIGAEIVCRFLQEGAKVYNGDIREAVSSIRDGKGSFSAKFLPLNVSMEESWKSAIHEIRTGPGKLDILVNNAGINVRKDIEEIPEESFDAMLAVNVKGPFLGIKHAIPLMKESGGGVILNMASVCGIVGHKYTNEAYTTTKGAVTLLTKSIASRYAEYNIRCNSVHPSTVDTPMLQSVLKNPDRRAERFNEIPLGRLASVKDVADAFVYLASDEAGFINGVAFPVDGGLTCY